MPVRAVQRVGHLDRIAEDLFHRQRAARQTRRERLALEILHHEIRDAVLLADVVEDADVRVVQRRNCARLAVEPEAQRFVVAVFNRERLDGDGAIEPRVDGLVDLAHAARPDGGHDLVRTESGPWGDGRGHSPRIIT